MYEELLPYWRAWCKCYASESELTGMWTRELQARGFRFTPVVNGAPPEIPNDWEWIKRRDLPKVKRPIRGLSREYQYPKDCLVRGVMLFTWEQGVES